MMPKYLSELAARIDELDKLSRTRALTLAESIALERAIKEHDRIAARIHPPWSRTEDEIAREMRANGRSCGVIARRLPCRSTFAVASRLRYLNAKEVHRA